jgi:hypothetical protein
VIACRITVALAMLALMLGAGHLSMLAITGADATVGGLWFAGAGLAIVFAALQNLTGARTPLFSVAGATLLAVNLLMCAYFAAAWPLLRGPQVLIGETLFVGLTALTLVRRRPRLAL